MGYEIKTKRGYDFYEVSSSFQKSIRRGIEDDALFWGAELWDSGYIKYAWKRMAIMCSEDVGLAEPSCIVQFMALKQSHDFLVNECNEKDNALPFFHAIILLCRSRKSRYVDFAISVYFDKVQRERREIQDYALDGHTRRGKAMGRGDAFFYQESCKINNARKIDGEEEMEMMARKIDKISTQMQREDNVLSDAEMKGKVKPKQPSLFDNFM